MLIKFTAYKIPAKFLAHMPLISAAAHINQDGTFTILFEKECGEKEGWSYMEAFYKYHLICPDSEYSMERED
jgi:hypothetical protein